jgi:hypothetical protein
VVVVSLIKEEEDATLATWFDILAVFHLSGLVTDFAGKITLRSLLLVVGIVW